MYVIVTYDLPLNERPAVFRLLNIRLNRLQGSVFAGTMSRQECNELKKDLQKLLREGACLLWILDRQVQPILIGTQEDKETNFL